MTPCEVRVPCVTRQSDSFLLLAPERTRECGAASTQRCYVCGSRVCEEHFITSRFRNRVICQPCARGGGGGKKPKRKPAAQFVPAQAEILSPADLHASRLDLCVRRRAS